MANPFFFVNTGNQKQRLFYEAIYYIEGDGNYVNYHTEKRKIMVRSTIKKTLAVLPVDNFIQLHRSYIVALSWIDKIEDNHVFIGEKQIPIGATYRTDFLRKIEALK